MHQPKPLKGELPDKNLYTIHSTQHSLSNTSQDDYIQVVSIDPATDNFGYRIERRYKSSNIIKTIAYDKIKFDKTITPDSISVLYYQVTILLEKYKSHYNDCHMFIIERQLAINYNATRIMQHVISYFITVSIGHPKSAFVVELDPKVKGKMLGAPKDCSKKELKAWAVWKCDILLNSRCDIDGLRLFRSYGKKLDDLADTVVQIEGFFKLIGLSLTIIPQYLSILRFDFRNPQSIPPPPHKQILIIENNSIPQPRRVPFIIIED